MESNNIDIQKELVELTPQEEVDCNDQEEPIYNYQDPKHLPPFPTDYTVYNIKNVSEEELCVAIGRDGCYLKRITENNKIAYIYHNKEKNRFEIWGKSSKFDKIIKEIDNRINLARQQLLIKEHYITL